jgi:L-asparaginase II
MLVVFVLGWIIKVSKQVFELLKLAKRSSYVICAKMNGGRSIKFKDGNNGKVQNKLHYECSVKGICALFHCNADLNLDLRNYSAMC